MRLVGRDWRYIYVAAALLLPMLPYVVAEPWIRYRYPIAGILVFLAADLVWHMAQSQIHPGHIETIVKSTCREPPLRQSPAVS